MDDDGQYGVLVDVLVLVRADMDDRAPGDADARVLANMGDRVGARAALEDVVDVDVRADIDDRADGHALDANIGDRGGVHAVDHSDNAAQVQDGNVAE